MLVHEYELFKMKNYESISEMFTRLTNIINDLKSLWKLCTNAENLKNILRSSPKNWEAKVTAIQEAKDLKMLSLDELMGSLMTHEVTMRNHQEETKPKKSLALKLSHSKK